MIAGGSGSHQPADDDDVGSVGVNSLRMADDAEFTREHQRRGPLSPRGFPIGSTPYDSDDTFVNGVAASPTQTSQ